MTSAARSAWRLWRLKLICGHTGCKKCLVDAVTSTKSCSVCHDLTTTTFVQRLRVNIFIQNMAASYLEEQRRVQHELERQHVEQHAAQQLEAEPRIEEAKALERQRAKKTRAKKKEAQKKARARKAVEKAQRVLFFQPAASAQFWQRQIEALYTFVCHDIIMHADSGACLWL